MIVARLATACITWLHRWALTTGKRGAIFAGEPEVPNWVQTLSRRQRN